MQELTDLPSLPGPAFFPLSLPALVIVATVSPRSAQVSFPEQNGC